MLDLTWTFLRFFVRNIRFFMFFLVLSKHGVHVFCHTFFANNCKLPSPERDSLFSLIYVLEIKGKTACAHDIQKRLIRPVSHGVVIVVIIIVIIIMRRVNREVIIMIAVIKNGTFQFDYNYD